MVAESEQPNIAPPQLKETGPDRRSLSSGHHQTPSPTPSVIKKEEEEFKPGYRFYLVFATISILTLMVALDGTSISVALPIIAKKLHGDAIQAFWAGTSFLLCSTVFQPNFASFSHIFGRKIMVMISILLFLVGSLVGALANNFTVLLVGRCVQGIGGGGIIALTEILVTDLVPLRLRGQWFGIISGTWSVGSVTGPIIGGVFAQSVSWRWIFYINLPFIGIGLSMVWFFLRLNFQTSTFFEKLRRVDWVGTILFIGSMTSFLVPVTWGGVMYAWDSWHTLAPLLISIAGLAGFVLFEIYVAPEPLIRLAIFQTTTAKVSYFGTVIHGLCLWCGLYYQPLYFEAVKGFTPIMSGVSLFPQTFTVAPSAMLVGFLVTYTGKYRWAIWGGWTLSTLGLGLLVLLDVNTSTVAWIFIMLVSGFGFGMLFPSLAFAIQASSTNADLAFAVAMFSFFRAFGQSIGVAIGGVTFQNQMKKKLMSYPALAPMASTYAKDAAGLVQIIKGMAEGPDKENLKTAYANSLKTVWILICVLSGVALAVSLLTKAYDLNRALETEQGFKHQRASDEEKPKISMKGGE